MDREHEAIGRLERARATLLATGQALARSEGGRAPARSEVFREAQAEIHAAEQERNRLLVELVGDDESVSVQLASRLGLTGREAVHIIRTARGGSPRMHEHVLGTTPEW
ncbi:hypothetical protein AB0L97_33095 [Nocardia sp. NPDC051911]|uniref:hypothetical protein n=1 Tax=Nocardia sp. NPDC051911 TaxID=3154648 RepID=UPI003418FE85